MSASPRRRVTSRRMLNERVLLLQHGFRGNKATCLPVSVGEEDIGAANTCCTIPIRVTLAKAFCGINKQIMEIFASSLAGYLLGLKPSTLSPFDRNVEGAPRAIFTISHHGNTLSVNTDHSYPPRNLDPRSQFDLNIGLPYPS